MIAKNPYLLADIRQATARRRLDPLSRLGPLVPTLAGLVALPFVQKTLYPFLLDPRNFSTGLRELLLRLGLGLAAALCLSSFSRLVRGPDRGVLDILPLRTEDWLKARILMLCRERLPWLGPACVLLFPLRENPVLLAFCLLFLGGAWVAGLGMGVGVNLVAPTLGTSVAWAPVIDAIRGVQPRLQAALIWAPGVALAFSGLPVGLSAIGIQRIAEGDFLGSAFLVLPWMAGIAGFGMAWRGRRNIARIPAILGEVDAAWAQVEDPEEARRVYLDWILRWMPEKLVLPLQKDLREGWREWRGLLSGSWGLAALTALAGWSARPDALNDMARVGGASAMVLGGLGIWLQDPPWLKLFLPISTRRRMVARAFAVWAWSQPVLLAGAASVVVRQGAWRMVGEMELRGFLLAATAAFCGGTMGRKGLWVWMPVAMVLVAG